MKTWNERITYAREQAGLEKAEFARRVGVKAPTVTDWESGGIKSLSAENLISISTVTGFNPKWLQTGTGPMRPASHVGPAIPADRPIPSSFRSETKAPLPPTDLETPPERPPVIPDEEWAKLSPSGRALIETAYRSIADQALSEAQVLAITQLILSTSDRNRK